MRFLPVSLTVLLVELADLDETLALFASLEADPVDGIADMVPAARTLMIRFRPEKLSVPRNSPVKSPRAISRPVSRLPTNSSRSPSAMMARILRTSRS